MHTPPHRSIQASPPETLAIFDFRVPGTGCRMRREMYAWKHCASIERLDQHHAVLIVRPGGARELAC
ncbi:MAG: hypothetical protein AVDCRST_MAG93-5949 [uncultured Chloroflexia bacterium]|uniref:Uncharacterized protein n=1 Tax=uncultured Chloroflexia bacterium TaxID=1672391 RepID=A0A6J4L730_9CHLR|nr:MAG: hypothetical protein AVDCRST_MAG93-5949 [uncultured Chloroflexia bacterium]